VLSVLAASTAQALVTPRSSHSPDACPGYQASNFHQTPTTFTADLTLAGKPCNVYGTDLAHLKLEVDHETGKLHSHFHESTTL
jgi:alpha-glucosidase